jgi:hypothetical protein
MIPPTTGASLQSETCTPTLDLAALSHAVHVALAPDPSGSTTAFLSFDRHCNSLRLDAAAVLNRLGTVAHFLHDADPGPPAWQTVRVGGRIVQGSDQALRQALLALAKQIGNQFDELCTREALQPQQFIIDHPEPALQALGKKVGGYLDRLESKALTRVQRMAFAEPQVAVPDPTQVGRVISATELIEVGDGLTLLLDAIGRLMRQRPDTWSMDDIERTQNDLRGYYQQGDPQLRQFVDLFLPEEAFSRIRATVARDVMAAIQRIAEQRPNPDTQLAAEYLRRVVFLHDHFSNPEHDERELELDKHYGPGAGDNILLSTELMKSTFYSSLPVWCGWHTPLLEAPSTGPQGQDQLIRWIGYRFKINGRDPERRESAFELRLRRLRETLLPETAPERWSGLARSLVQLLVLAIVVPRDKPEAELNADVGEKIHAAIKYFNDNGQDATRNILASLEQRIAVMQRIAGAVIGILKRKGPLFNELARQPRSYYLNIKRSILNRERAFEGLPEPLVKPAPGQDQRIAFFNCLQVSTADPLPDALFSLRVTVRLGESLLHAPHNTLSEYRVQRQPPKALVQILWQPGANTTPQLPIENWRLASSLRVHYDPELLGVADAHRRDPQQRQQLAARRVAFTVLVYIALQVLCERLIACAPQRGPQMNALMLRFQQQGRSAGEHQDLSGEQGLYAAAQAIEHALGQHLRTRMQGLTSADDPYRFRSRNSFNALLSAFPLQMQTPSVPTLERIGVLTFVSRPATDHPALSEDSQRDFVLLGRSYIAQANPQLPGYRLASGPNLLALEPGREVFADSPSIFKAIERLYQQGCRSLLYMGHRRGGRQVGRARTPHRHHEQPRFLAEIQRRFPDLCVYPLVHDVFPATRLRKRGDNEDAFEIPDYHVPLQRWNPNLATPHDHDLIPVYTFATLHVISDEGGEAGRPQSGFAIYFLMSQATPESLEQETRKRLDWIGTDSPRRHDLIAVLRSLHYLESEAPARPGKAPTWGDPSPSGQNAPSAPAKCHYVLPVLDPYAALQPASIAAIGEISVHPRTRSCGEVLLSLPAVLARVTEVLALSPAPHTDTAT